MRLSVVIVNYNTGSLLQGCLASIGDKFSSIDHEVIVVDNASSDRSGEAVSNNKEAILIPLDKNIGFGAGCNKGVEKTSGDFILFLNPDTVILSDNIDALLNKFQSMDSFGALGCQNLLPSGTVQTTAYRFPGLLQLFFFVFKFRELLTLPGLRKLLSPILGKKFGQFSPHRHEEAVDWVTGAFLLVKRDAWNKVGEFDERFFLFCEEIDWCLRLKESGMKLLFYPGFEIEHHVGYSSRNVKPFVMLQKYKSYLSYFKKHHAGLREFMARMIVWSGLRFWIVLSIIRKDKELLNLYKTLLSGLK